MNWHVVMANIRASKDAEPAWMEASGGESVCVSMLSAKLVVGPSKIPKGKRVGQMKNAETTEYRPVLPRRVRRRVGCK